MLARFLKKNLHVNPFCLGEGMIYFLEDFLQSVSQDNGSSVWEQNWRLRSLYKQWKSPSEIV